MVQPDERKRLSAEAEELERRVEELIGRAGEGDQEAIGALYELYQKRMISVAHARLGHTLHSLTESVDLVQSVWTDLLEEIDEFEYRGPDSFYAWLRTCLLRKIDSKRRHHGALKRDSKKVQNLEREEHLTSHTTDPTPSQLAMGGEEQAILMGLLERFPEAQREVLVLRLRDDLTYAAIGEKLGRSTESVKKTYRRGIERLIELLPADWK